MGRRSLTRYAWLSIAAAVFTMGLKAAAYFLTGSVGLLSDALESVVNLVGGVMALAMLTVAARPPGIHFGVLLFAAVYWRLIQLETRAGN